MLYSTIVQRDNSGMNQIIAAAEAFSQSGFMESLQLCNFDRHKVEQVTDMVRMYQVRLNIESRELVYFSENFIQQYATDNNKCFEMAINLMRNLKTTITGTMRIFRKFCPVVRRKLWEPSIKVSALERNRLVYGFQYELFGLEEYPEYVQTLFHELNTFFSHLITSLQVCKDMIRKEEKVRHDPELLKQIYESSCEEALTGLRHVINTFGSVKFVSEEEMEKHRKNARPLSEWLAEEYHNHDKDWMTKHAYVRYVMAGQQKGLDDEAAILWKDNLDKGHEMVDIISRLDSVGLTFNKAKSSLKNGKMGRYDSDEMVRLIKYSGVGYEDEVKFYRYLENHYHGNYDLPTWQAVCRTRKVFEDKGKSVERMISDISKLVERMNNSKAQLPLNNVPLQPTA